MTHPQDRSTGSSIIEVDLYSTLPPPPTARDGCLGSRAHSAPSVYGGLAPFNRLSPSWRTPPRQSTAASWNRVIGKLDEFNEYDGADSDGRNRLPFLPDVPVPYQVPDPRLALSARYSFLPLSNDTDETRYSLSFPPSSNSARVSHTLEESSRDRDFDHGRDQGNGNGLPEFTRWSPTWRSGGYSDDGRAYTTHSPASSRTFDPYNRHITYQQQEQKRQRQRQEQEQEPNGDGHEQAESSTAGGGWALDSPHQQVGEWQGTDVGGDYRHGVGFEPASEEEKAKNADKVAERMRRLERVFGSRGAATIEAKEMTLSERMKWVKEERKRDKRELIERSGVDSKGRLVVQGAKKRTTCRWIQGLSAVVVGCGSLGAFILVHPNPSPPASSKLQYYLLCVMPFISIVATLYLFVFRPCCARRRQPNLEGDAQVALPLLQPGQATRSSGGCCCFGRRKRPNHQQQAGATVNLVLNQEMLDRLAGTHHHHPARTQFDYERDRRRRRRRRRHRRVKEMGKGKDTSSGEDSDSSTLSSSSDVWSLPGDPSDRLHSQRRSVLAPAQLEARWRAARSSLRTIIWVDTVFALVWGFVAVWSIGFGKPCKPGSFQGWCNLYNTALAFSLFSSLAFFASVFFDIVDLRRTRVPPR